jgi:hypothetical protein
VPPAIIWQGLVEAEEVPGGARPLGRPRFLDEVAESTRGGIGREGGGDAGRRRAPVTTHSTANQRPENSLRRASSYKGVID